MLDGSAAGAKRQADAKVGDVDCYVLTSELKGSTGTLWIGKQDLLIHQDRIVTSAAAMKTIMAAAAKANPGLPMPEQKFDGITQTQTHTNIVVNQLISPADFAP
jgi:hypothetical protein